MNIRLEQRDNFTISGYLIETLPTDDSYDTKCIQLRKEYEKSLRESATTLYGATWFTNDGNLYYLFGAEQVDQNHAKNSNVSIPGGLFAVATIPDDTPLIQAWNEMWSSGLPSINRNYIENEKCFELFGENNLREIWVPVA